MWLNRGFSYINLSSEDTVRPIQLFTKSDHLLEWPILQHIKIGSPAFSFATYEDGDGEWEPIIETQINQGFAKFAKEMEAGRQSAILKDHRADTALRFFARACSYATTQPWNLDTD